MNEARTIVEMHTLLAVVCCNSYRTHGLYTVVCVRNGNVDWVNEYPYATTGTEILKTLGTFLVYNSLRAQVGGRAEEEFTARLAHLHAEYKGSFEEYECLTRLQTQAKIFGDAYPMHRAFFESITLPPYDDINVSYYERLNICTQMMEKRDDQDADALSTFVSRVRGDFYLDNIGKLADIATWHPRMVDVTIALKNVPEVYEYLFDAVRKCVADERVAAAKKNAAIRKSLAITPIEEARSLNTSTVNAILLCNKHIASISSPPNAPGGPSIDMTTVSTYESAAV